VIALVVIALVLALVGLALQLRDGRRERKRRIAACEAAGHRWRYSSLGGEGRFWSRHCPECGKNEPVDGEKVPERVRRQHRP
jgi:hypothetical protein